MRKVGNFPFVRFPIAPVLVGVVSSQAPAQSEAIPQNLAPWAVDLLRALKADLKAATGDALKLDDLTPDDGPRLQALLDRAGPRT